MPRGAAEACDFFFAPRVGGPIPVEYLSSAIGVEIMRQNLTKSGAPQVYVIHENDAWVEPLRAAFEKRGIPFREWHLDEGILTLRR